VADLHSALCTCEWVWAGDGERPLCPLHEGGKLPRGFARRSDGQVVNVLASAGFARKTGGGGTWSTDLQNTSGVISYGR
jgi:hypothetical protein